MKPESPVSIAGFAGCTSLGYSLAATLPAMGAGLSNFADSGIMNLHGTVATTGALLEPELPRIERLAALARVGLVDLRALLQTLAVDHAPFMIGVAPDLSGEEQAALEQELRDSDLVRPTVAWYRYGRASSLLALAHAVDLVGRRAHRLIVVGGIDSLCARDTVRALVHAQRVLGPYVEGTIPAEAAVFALVARSDDPVINQSTAVGVDAVVQRKAAVPYLIADRVSGDGLASTFRRLRETGARQVDRVVAAHSGEGYFSRSFAYAYLREVEIMPEPLRVDLTADCVGDIGAATGMLALAFGAYLMVSEPNGADNRVLAYTESDTGEIGAAVIEGAPISWHYANPVGELRGGAWDNP
jgi:3-oxoacyl-[acyl-carrier-protein] synthase-1